MSMPVLVLATTPAHASPCRLHTRARTPPSPPQPQRAPAGQGLARGIGAVIGGQQQDRIPAAQLERMQVFSQHSREDGQRNTAAPASWQEAVVQAGSARRAGGTRAAPPQGRSRASVTHKQGAGAWCIFKPAHSHKHEGVGNCQPPHAPQQGHASAVAAAAALHAALLRRQQGHCLAVLLLGWAWAAMVFS